MSKDENDDGKNYTLRYGLLFAATAFFFAHQCGVNPVTKMYANHKEYSLEQKKKENAKNNEDLSKIDARKTTLEGYVNFVDQVHNDSNDRIQLSYITIDGKDFVYFGDEVLRPAENVTIDYIPTNGWYINHGVFEKEFLSKLDFNNSQRRSKHKDRILDCEGIITEMRYIK